MATAESTMSTADIIALAQLIATIVGLYLVVRQIRLSINALKESSESGEVAHLMLVLAVENQLSDLDIRAVEAEATSEPTAKNLRLQYLDVLNRFCHCIRLGFVNEETYKMDYRDKIRRVVEKNPLVFDGASDFQHVQHVHVAWKNEKTAADRKELRRSQTIT